MQAGLEDWNTLRLVLAVGRARGLTGAASRLGVDHSTVFRRLHALEAAIGRALFERRPGGVHAPTEAGARLIAAAEAMEDAALAAARGIAGGDPRLTGRLVVTSSETLAYRLLADPIAAFRVAHPGVLVELAIDNRVLSLSRREADVALRPLRPRGGDLWGRKLADVAWGVYGAPAYLDRAGSPAAPADLAGHAMIGWEEQAAGIAAADWLDASVPGTAFVFRTSSVVTQMVAARAAIGLAVLPCYLGDPEPGLRRVLPLPLPDLAAELWIVTHTDLRRTGRVRAFFDVAGAAIGAQRALLEGRPG